MIPFSVGKPSIFSSLPSLSGANRRGRLESSLDMTRLLLLKLYEDARKEGRNGTLGRSAILCSWFIRNPQESRSLWFEGGSILP
jgi:hypothetical protein